MKKTKLKLLLLAMLGLTIIPTTNAYELGVKLNETNANYDVGYKDAKFALYNSFYSYIVARPCSNSSQGSKCFSAPYYSSSIFDYSYGIYVSLDSWSFNKFFGVAYKDNGEGRDFYYSAYSDNKAVQKLFNTPSRTAFSVKMTNGKEYLMDTVYFYHNTLVFMDSRNGFTLYLNGNIKAKDGVVFVDPFLKEDNFFLIRFQEKKAWSMTVSEAEAWKRFFGKTTGEEIKTLKFTKSYELREGGETIFPINFHVHKDKQGGPGYTYQEDIEFVSPGRGQGGNNQNNNQNNIQELEAYNACYSYYDSIRIYTSYDYNCYKSLLDSAPLTGSYDASQLLKPWQDIKDWNGEGNIGIQTQDLICHKLIKLKREYKQQYQGKRDDFLKISSENFFYPHAMDIKAYCGERPVEKKWYEKAVDWVGDYWNKITGKEKIGEVDGKLVSKKEFDKSLINLGLLKAKCDNPGAYMFGVPIWDHMRKLEEYRTKFCNEYNEALSGHNLKYNKIQYASGYKELYEGSGEKVDDWGLSQVITYFQADYNSGYSFIAGDIKSCNNPIFFKEWDFLVYVPFFLICFYIIKYMFF